MNVQPTAVVQLQTWLGWPLLLLVAVSVGYESLFIHHGIAWLFDEGWPLYAAMRLHEGGVLYRDVFFPFPPGHLLPAWVAYGIDPPGILLARIFYACFNVALCLSIYLLGRRILRPPFALLAALLLAIAAPRSHLAHLLFGYRYLIFSVLTLLAFSHRLRAPADETRRAWCWMFAAGAAAGVALFFRLTPAFAVSCGVGVAAITATRDWRQWRRDGAAFGLGMALVVVPTLAWFAFSVGLDVLWQEVVERIVALQGAQRLPSPEFSLLPPSSDRRDVYRWFIALQYRLYILMYAGYVVGLIVQWARSLLARRPFDQPLLLAISIWGGLYLLRALGRSDDHHLMTALPPACLLLAHAFDSLSRRVGSWLSAPPVGSPRGSHSAVCVRARRLELRTARRPVPAAAIPRRGPASLHPGRDLDYVPAHGESGRPGGGAHPAAHAATGSCAGPERCAAIPSVDGPHGARSSRRDHPRNLPGRRGGAALRRAAGDLSPPRS